MILGPSAASTTYWRLAEPQLLVWRVWENEVVAHDQRTGDTHLLLGALSDVFAVLAEHDSPLTSTDIARALPAQPDVGALDVRVSAVEDALSQLQLIRLVESRSA